MVASRFSKTSNQKIEATTHSADVLISTNQSVYGRARENSVSCCVKPVLSFSSKRSIIVLLSVILSDSNLEHLVNNL